MKLLHRCTRAGLLALPLLAPFARAAGTDPAHAARAGETVVTWGEFERLLIDRYALSEVGRGALTNLLKARVLDHLGAEAGLEISEAQLEARLAEFERELLLEGVARSLGDYLEEHRVDAQVFRTFMRRGMIQEVLARRALGIPESGPISGEQQEMWLEGRMAELGVEEYERPWTEGVVCRCGPVRLPLPDFLEHLRSQLEEAELRESLYQQLVVKRLRARMPDLSEEAIEKTAKDEVARRRANVGQDPRYKGVPYEQLLESQGIRYETWHRDPAVLIAALTELWVGRSYTDDDLKRVYADEREHFDGTYGEAIEVWAVFLRAGKFKNDFLKRTYEEAEKALYGWSEGVRSRAEFEALVRERSEDDGTRQEGGRVGWVTRAGEERHLALKAAIFEALDSGRYSPGLHESSRKRLLGPLRTTTGCVLFWLGDHRPTPGWERMVIHVREELRARFLRESLDPREIVTYLDQD